MNIAEWWPVITASALVVIGKVIIVWLALRKTDPADRPAIITALAELFRWWRPR